MRNISQKILLLLAYNVKYITHKNIAKIGNYHRSKCCYMKNIAKLETTIVQNVVSRKNITKLETAIVQNAGSCKKHYKIGNYHRSKCCCFRFMPQCTHIP